jgi:plasmid stabilization system protein ParE
MTQSAEDDLSANLNYITDELQNPIAAEKLYNEFEIGKKSLEYMPYRFPLVRDEYLAQNGIRAMMVKNYQLFYIVNEPEQKVLIIRFLYGRRDWKSLLLSSVFEPD